MERPILGFDTSVISALRNDELAAEPLLAELNAGYAVCLNGTALDEIVAHSIVSERERLRKLCRRMLAHGEGHVLLPFQEITKKLATAFESGRPFDWTHVDVSSSEYVNFIFSDDVRDAFEEITDYEEVSAEQRASAEQTADEFERLFLDPRAAFQRLREEGTESWPASASELAQRFQRPGGMYWNFGAGLYRRATGVTVDEEKIRKFVAECPPFRALLAAVVVAQYDRSISEDVKAKRAGRNDVFMASYLPYCNEFISNDHRQQVALRQIVAIAGLETTVSWYKEFSARFSVGLVQKS